MSRSRSEISSVALDWSRSTGLLMLGACTLGSWGRTRVQGPPWLASASVMLPVLVLWLVAVMHIECNLE